MTTSTLSYLSKTTRLMIYSSSFNSNLSVSFVSCRDKLWLLTLSCQAVVAYFVVPSCGCLLSRAKLLLLTLSSFVMTSQVVGIETNRDWEPFPIEPWRSDSEYTADLHFISISVWLRVGFFSRGKSNPLDSKRLVVTRTSMYKAQRITGHSKKSVSWSRPHREVRFFAWCSAWLK